METTKQVFISYATEDYEKAKKVFDDLKREGIETWLDRENLLPGQNWKHEIRHAMKNSKYFLALLSSHSVSKKGYVQKEMRMALDILEEFPESEIFLIPARLDECHPTHEKLEDLHWVDLFPSYEHGLKNILKVLKPDTVNLTIIAPGDMRFEADVSHNTLIDQLLRDFLGFWQPEETEASLLRHGFCLVSGSEKVRLNPANTLAEAGLFGQVEIELCSEALLPESAVRLGIENEKGERFETFVLLNTKIKTLAEAFLKQFQANLGNIGVELMSGFFGGQQPRIINPDHTLYEEKITDENILRIYCR